MFQLWPFVLFRKFPEAVHLAIIDDDETT